jgi:hypothetical protein
MNGIFPARRIARAVPCALLTVAVLALLMCVTATQCVADTRDSTAVTPLENGPDGPVVKVTLKSRKPGVQDRELRFLLDTGAVISVLDRSVPDDYFWESAPDPQSAAVTLSDATQQAVTVPVVYLKRLEVGGISRDDQPAIRLDLKRTWPGLGQDDPVDGILGMSFLRGTAFVIDAAAGQVQWWRTFAGSAVGLRYNESGSPLMIAKLSGADVPFMIDTGADGGFQAPGQVDEKDGPSEVVHFMGMLGQATEARRICVDRIEAGGKTWTNVAILVVTPGVANPLVGRRILLAGRLGLDFTRDTATFEADSTARAPVSPRAATHDELSLMWDRNGAVPTLRVGPQGGASPMSVAGLREGDEVVRVGPLSGRDLTIATVEDLIAKDRSARWTVMRGEKTFQVRLSAADKTVKTPTLGCR